MMLPRLDPTHVDLERLAHADVYLTFLDALTAAGFEGDIEADAAARVAASVDNSVYQVLPRAVLLPRHREDVLRVLRLLDEARFHRVSVTPRGGGTGTNGQSLTDGLVLDLSRHMARILDVDLDAGTVRVEPGVVLDQLNAALRPHGVFFAPNLSPSSRATLGGMINTDACGKGSRVYGRTSDHTLALDLAMVGGEVWAVAPMDAPQVDAAKAGDGAPARAVRELHRVVTERAELIREIFPGLRRGLTGYNLAHVSPQTCGCGHAHAHDHDHDHDHDHEPEAGPALDPTFLVAGSEGTLGIVLEATLQLTPIPNARRLVVLQYASFYDALGSAEVVVKANPSAIETVDERVLSLARADSIWHRVGPILDSGHPEAAPEGVDVTLRADTFATVNLVEFEGTDRAAIDAKVEALLQTVRDQRGAPDTPVGAVVADAPDALGALWALRKKGVGLLGAKPGRRKPVAFVEDTVVPPERLRDYIKEFRAILDAEGLEYGMFGHIDVGCLHVRPALDLTDPADEARLARISDAVCELTQRYGGLIWGEHGKGYRSEYLPRFFGDELYGEVRRLKAACDPRGQLNPGKIAVPADQPGELVSVAGPLRGARDRTVDPSLRDHFAVAMACNGNGQCHDWDPDHLMCPSAKVTRDRVHSPKGRATLMREWLRLLGQAGVPASEVRATALALPAPSPLAALGRALAAPARFLRRVIATLAPGDDFSQEVERAMHGCLSCKACATQCPIKVDVPTFKADFLASYHTRYLRPPRDLLLARLEASAPLMAKVPRLANAVTRSAPARAALRAFGLVDTPALSVPTAAAGLRERAVPVATVAALEALTDAERADAVVLVPDVFTTFYEAPVLLATVDTLRAMGQRVFLAPFRPNGKGLHVKGMLRAFRKAARRQAMVLRPLGATGVPLVSIEPAVALTYRDEYHELFGRLQQAQGFTVRMLHEHLDAHRDALARALESRAGGVAPKGPEGGFALFGHCTERTAEPTSPAAWRRVFQAAGLPLRPEPVGCCGMCGVYGHERDHAELSRQLYAMSWRPALERLGAADGGDPSTRRAVVATGHSCRSQIERVDGWAPDHPIQVLARALGQP